MVDDIEQLKRRICHQHNTIEVLKSAYAEKKKQVEELQDFIKGELARNNKPQN